MHLKTPLFIAFLIILISSCSRYTAQKQIIAFYNLENLFDTIDSPNVNDTEFTPQGKRKWDSERYHSKINKISSVISIIGEDEGIHSPALLGVCEIENRKVLDDLIQSPNLNHLPYKILHYDSPDKRGIDVALIYNSHQFKVLKNKPYPLKLIDETSGNRIYTRDQLYVYGILNGDSIHLIVNHWPSRYGGSKRSIPLRKAAALLNRSIIDSVLHINAHAKIITMGDLNDNPIDESVRIHLGAKSTIKETKESDLFNPMYSIFKSGCGSLYYRGKWNLFDQIIVSQSFLNKQNSGYKLETVKVFKKPFLIQQSGNYKGYLLRTYGGKTYLNGYSDHLPVYMVLTQRRNNLYKVK